MKYLKTLIVAVHLLAPIGILAAESAAPAQGALYGEIAALDAAVFGAFNRCSEPGEIDEYARYFAPDVEFYHDEAGVTWSRKEMVAATVKNVCGKFRRELVPGSLKVFPVKGFGAISQGTHKFCQRSSKTCEGVAEFTMIWREQQGNWHVTRVLSYGHRPNSQP